MSRTVLPSGIRSRWRDGFAYTIFALSGAAGLVFEISWSRQLGLVLGNTAQAVALVLAAFFLGLAAGQMLGSRLARRVAPLVGYGACELLTAGWGCVVPSLLTWVASLGGASTAGHAYWMDPRAICGVLVLLPATVPLGASFPFIAEYLSGGGGNASRRVILAYGANSVGGLLGVLGATSAGLVVVGVIASCYLAFFTAATCGIAALVLAARGRAVGEVRGTSPQPAEQVSGSWFVLAAVSGFATLGLEVLYTRMFALVFHNSTYSFGAVLATFIAGLSAGAFFVAAVGTRVKPMTLALGAGGLGAVAVPLSVVLFVGLTDLEYFDAGDTFAGYLGGVFALVAAVVLPPVTLLGMVLPAAFGAAGRAGGREAGRLASINTLAAAIGASAAGFLLMPRLGLWPSFGFLTVVLVVPSVVALLSRGRVFSVCVLASAVLAAVMVSGRSPGESRRGGVDGGEDLVRRWETSYGWVDVVRSRRDGSLKVRENLHYRHGSTGVNAVREYRQGRLPLLLHPRPTEVAFLGLGTGITAAPVVTDQDVRRAVVVELIPEVVEAARLLKEANAGVVDCPKVEVRVDDARHFLRYSDDRFDLIVSDLFVPWESRAGYLYTAEHYAAVRRCLKPGGLFCQWVALYQVGPEEWELIADSFASVFPSTTLWWGQFDARFGMVALVGSDGPLRITEGELDDRFRAIGDARGAVDPDLASPRALPELYLGDWPARPGRRLNTDEHPWLEFSAPVSQRSGRALAGPRLRTYFESVFATLRSEAAQFVGPLAAAAEPGRRRAVQSLSLFGEAGH